MKIQNCGTGIKMPTLPNKQRKIRQQLLFYCDTALMLLNNINAALK